MMATPAIALEREQRREGVVVLMPETDLTPAGIPIRVQWQPVEGATEAEVASASVSIAPAVRMENLGTLTLATDGDQRVVTVPSDKRIRSLTLSGFKTDDNAEAASAGDLSSRNRRLAVIVQAGNQTPAPQHTVPEIARRNLMPPLLTGASYENRVLTLPDVVGTKIRLALVEGNAPEDFQTRSMSLSSVTGVAAILPRDLEILEPDNSTIVWAFPGEMPAETPTQSAELRMSVQKLVSAALKSEQPLDFSFRLKTTNNARVRYSFSRARGALLRTFPGVITTRLEGDAVQLALVAAPPLAAEQPASAIADLTVKYDGFRVHSDLSDTVPPQAGNIGGPIVTDAVVTRPFPPAAFDSIAPARLGVIGRAPEECELSVQLIEMHGGALGKGIAPPTVRTIAADSRFVTHWFDLPALEPPKRHTGIAVRSTRGRFLWVAMANPLLRVAVRDPDPGGRPLQLDNSTILHVTQKETHVAAQNLPAAPFRSMPPLFSSDLFMTVDVSDLTLRYAR
jgi:hypothetical protein